VRGFIIGVECLQLQNVPAADAAQRADDSGDIPRHRAGKYKLFERLPFNGKHHKIGKLLLHSSFLSLFFSRVILAVRCRRRGDRRCFFVKVKLPLGAFGDAPQIAAVRPGDQNADRHGKQHTDTVDRTGNIGVVSATQLLNEEIKLRSRYSFWNNVFTTICEEIGAYYECDSLL
jgi:hypothetical protein